MNAATLDAPAPSPTDASAPILPPYGDADHINSIPPGRVFDALGTSRRGLTAQEASTRLACVGPNALPHVRGPRLITKFLRQFTDLFAVLLLAASAITLLAYFLSGDVSNVHLSVAILGVVVLNATIGFLQEYSAQRTAEALRALVPEQARVIRDGERNEIPAREIVPGDLVVLDAGDAVPCDCRLVEAHDLTVDMAPLTGESTPVARSAEPSNPRGGWLDSRNLVFMGTSVMSGTGRAIAWKTGAATQFGEIFHLTTQVEQGLTPLQRQIADMARRVAGAAIAIGALVFPLRAVSGSTLLDAFVLALGVMVALVPEGLPATLSVSLAIGVRRMAQRHALIKRLLAVEALGSTTVICTDKTGTLTTAQMTAVATWASGQRGAISGVGYTPEGEVEHVVAVRELLRAAALCSDARLVAPDSGASHWRVLGDSTEAALLVAAKKAGLQLEAESDALPRVGVFPFDSERKLMTTIHRSPDGFEAFTKGSPQEVLSRCAQALWNGQTVPFTREVRAQVELANDAFASEALRVLAVARHTVNAARTSQADAEHELTFLGLVAMADPPRPEVVEAVQRCHKAQIRIVMVTGDYGLTAEAIARKVGILPPGRRSQVVTGLDLDGMSEEHLAKLLRTPDGLIFARVKPEHKLRIVTALKALGEVVAVTGDGVNDAPALKRADIGVAMGLSGTDVSREAADMILLDDSFASIAVAVELGRSVYQNIRKFLIYLFSHNIGELVPILAASIVGFALVPLGVLQILAIDLGSDVMPALALGAEPPEPGVMDRPPRQASEHLFSLEVVGRFLFLGVIQAAGVTFAFFWRIHSAGLPFTAFTAANAVYREAITMTQAGIVVSQFFNGFAVRSNVESIFRIGLLSNWRLVVAEMCGVGIMCAISYLPPLQYIFNTAPLKPFDWLMLACFGLALLVAEELRKLWLRTRRNAPTDTT